jgi:hypothetical protein
MMKPETFMLAVTGLVVLMAVGLSMSSRTDEVPPSEPMPLPGGSARYQPYVYLDQVTGCEYLSTHLANGLVPRIAADGKTHMGCKAAAP